MDMRRLVGRNLRRIREAQEIRQEKLAELSGFGQQYISDIERGRRNPTVVTLFHLATALGVVPADLVVFDDGDPGDAPPSRARAGPAAGRKKRQASGDNGTDAESPHTNE